MEGEAVEKTAAQQETYQGVPVNVYDLLTNVHAVRCRLDS